MRWNRKEAAKWIDTAGAGVVLFVCVAVCLYISFAEATEDRVLNENAILAEVYNRAAGQVLDGKATISTDDIQNQRERTYEAECDYLGHDRTRQLGQIDGYQAVSARVDRARQRYESALNRAD